jgi:hypothetical protein
VAIEEASQQNGGAVKPKSSKDWFSEEWNSEEWSSEEWSSGE